MGLGLFSFLLSRFRRPLVRITRFSVTQQPRSYTHDVQLDEGVATNPIHLVEVACVLSIGALRN